MLDRNHTPSKGNIPILLLYIMSIYSRLHGEDNCRNRNIFGNRILQCISCIRAINITLRDLLITIYTYLLYTNISQALSNAYKHIMSIPFYLYPLCSRNSVG